MIRAALLTLCLATPSFAADKTVAVVSAHLGDFAQDLAGEGIEIYFPVAADRDPALWRPSVQEIGEIQSADLIVLNGADFARWTKRTSLPRAKLVDAGRGLSDRFIVTEGSVTHSHGGDEEHSHDGIAPQIWLDFTMAEAQALAVAEALERRLGLDVKESADELSASLQELDARAKRVLGEADLVLGSGPGFEYFLRAYAPASATVTDVESIEAVLSETFPSGNRQQAEILLLSPTQTSETQRMINRVLGLQDVTFDFGSAPDAASFVERMKANLDRIEAALAR